MTRVKKKSEAIIIKTLKSLKSLTLSSHVNPLNLSPHSRIFALAHSRTSSSLSPTRALAHFRTRALPSPPPCSLCLREKPSPLSPLCAFASLRETSPKLAHSHTRALAHSRTSLPKPSNTNMISTLMFQIRDERYHSFASESPDIRRQIFYIFAGVGHFQRGCEPWIFCTAEPSHRFINTNIKSNIV